MRSIGLAVVLVAFVGCAGNAPIMTPPPQAPTSTPTGTNAPTVRATVSPAASLTPSTARPSVATSPVPSTAGDLVAIPTQEPPPALPTPQECPAAALPGTLVAHSAWGVAVRYTGTDGAQRVQRVLWPYGWHALRNDRGTTLLDQNGRAVSHTGDEVVVGGGEFGDQTNTWFACPGLEVVSSLPVVAVDDPSGAIKERIEGLIDADGCVVEGEMGFAGWPMKQIEREAAELPGGVGFVLPLDAVYVGQPEDAAIAFGAVEALRAESGWSFIAPFGEQKWLTGYRHEAGEWVGAAMAEIELSGRRSAWAAGYYALAIGYDDCPD